VKAADKLYADLVKDGVEVLYDDRDLPAGAKFADADLIGVPSRLTVSARTLEQDAVEVKRRSEQEAQFVKLAEVAKTVKT
jgi:prolyl-tRNA synthetase